MTQRPPVPWLERQRGLQHLGIITAGDQRELAPLKGTGVKVYHLRLTLGTPDTPADDTQSLRQR